MIIKTESEKLEEQFWKNRPIYTIWGYEEDLSAEKLFSSKSVEETKSKMLDIIQNGYVYPYVSYGISLGSAENFDFYTYKPHDEPVFDIESELLNMENSLDCNTYTLYGFKESTIEKLFETQDIGKIKKKMREVIVNTVKSDAKPEYLHYSVCVNDSPCYDFDSNEIYEKKGEIKMYDKVKIDLFKSTSKAIDTYLRFSLLTENPAGDTPRKDAYTCSEKLLDIVKAKIKLIID